MSRRILVVDDDPAMVRTLCDVLRLRGWDSVGVHSGQAAVEAQYKDDFAFVVMDIIMPGVDGVTALKAMRRSHPEARVVLMTAHTAVERISEAMQAGALQVINKPIDLASLLGLLGPPGSIFPLSTHLGTA